MRIAIIAMLGLAACAPEASEPPVKPMPGEMSCGAGKLQHLVGEPVGVFDFETVTKHLRIIPPDTAVTLDYSHDRLNVDLDKNNRITRIWCG